MKGNPADSAARTIRGFMPGATPNAAPAAATCCTCSTVKTVPTPAIISGTLSLTALKASRAAGVRSVNSMISMPPSIKTLASGTASSTRSTTSTAITPVCRMRSRLSDDNIMVLPLSSNWHWSTVRKCTPSVLDQEGPLSIQQPQRRKLLAYKQVPCKSRRSPGISAESRFSHRGIGRSMKPS